LDYSQASDTEILASRPTERILAATAWLRGYRLH